jgi:transposase, IS6 family
VNASLIRASFPFAASVTSLLSTRFGSFTAEVILWSVRWYLMFPVSYRDSN